MFKLVDSCPACETVWLCAGLIRRKPSPRRAHLLEDPQSREDGAGFLCGELVNDRVKVFVIHFHLTSERPLRSLLGKTPSDVRRDRSRRLPPLIPVFPPIH